MSADEQFLEILTEKFPTVDPGVIESLLIVNDNDLKKTRLEIASQLSENEQQRQEYAEYNDYEESNLEREEPSPNYPKNYYEKDEGNQDRQADYTEDNGHPSEIMKPKPKHKFMYKLKYGISGFFHKSKDAISSKFKKTSSYENFDE